MGLFHDTCRYFWIEDNFTVNIMQLGNSGLFKNNTHCLRREESYNYIEKYVVLNDSPGGKKITSHLPPEPGTLL